MKPCGARIGRIVAWRQCKARSAGQFIEDAMQRSKDIRLVPLAIGFTFFGLAQGQITIDQNDMPSAGDINRRSTAALAQFDENDTGPGHVWDFSALQPQLATADTCVTVGSTPLLYQFFFNNPLVYPDHDADHAVRGQEFDFQALQITAVFDYFRRDADGFDNVGFGANINGLPSSVQRLPVDHVYELPLNFGNTSNSASAWEVEVPGLLFFRQEQDRDNSVDGWGTLYLPTDTFDVLRVTSVINRTDSVFVDQFGIGFSVPEPETIEYKWLADGMDVPVLQVNTVGGTPTTVSFWYDPLTLVPEDAVGFSLLAYPNPGSDIVHVRLPDASGGLLTLHDATGREVMTKPVARGDVLVSVDLTGYATGVHFLRMKGRAWASRLVIERDVPVTLARPAQTLACTPVAGIAGVRDLLGDQCMDTAEVGTGDRCER
jgi:hypothetical protein